MKRFIYWLILPSKKEIKLYIHRLLLRLDEANSLGNIDEYCKLLLELGEWLSMLPLLKTIKLGMELGGFGLIADDCPFDKWYFYCIGEGCNTTLHMEFIVNGNKHIVSVDRHL